MQFVYFFHARFILWFVFATETIRTIEERGAQDGHLDFHTAPQLCPMLEGRRNFPIHSTSFSPIFFSVRTMHLWIRGEHKLKRLRRCRIIPQCCPSHLKRAGDDVKLNILRCRVDSLGTNCDQCVCMVQCCFTSTETIRLIRTGSPGRPPRLSHSSWTPTARPTRSTRQTTPSFLRQVKSFLCCCCCRFQTV